MKPFLGKKQTFTKLRKMVILVLKATWGETMLPKSLDIQNSAKKSKIVSCD